MSPVKVLLVEDEKITRTAVAQMLRRLGYRAESFETAEEGLEAFVRDRFDAVLSDVVLPGMDGIELVRRLRAIDPVLAPVIMTSRRDQEVAKRALECGVREFLPKPFSEDQLSENMEKALEERRQALETRLLMGDLLEIRSQLEETVRNQHHQLVQTRQYLHQLINAAPFAIVSTSPQGEILTFNDAAQTMYGYTEGEVIGRPVSLLFDPASQPSSRGKATHGDKAGNAFPVLVWKREIQDVDHRSLGQLFIVEDVREQERLEEQLLYAEQLSTLGQLAPRIAHEFKTPLQLISGYVELVLEELPQADKAQIRSYLKFVQPAVRQIQRMVQQIAHLGKPRKTRPQALNLAEEMDRVLESLRHLGVVKHCRIERLYSQDAPLVRGDPAQIEQVFRNLIVNAAQAMEDFAERALTLQVRPGDQGRQVEVIIRDTGPGIPAEHMEKIFQPFFTTKPASKGTGLGLPIVKSILDHHGARIRVESTLGDGTRFHLYFPQVETGPRRGETRRTFPDPGTAAAPAPAPS